MWAQLTEDDWQSSVSDEEETAVRSAMLASGQEDPFEVVKRQVTALFRNAIRSHSGNRLDADEATLPPAAIYHAVAKLRFRLLTRFCSELITDDRRTENKEAESWLKEVRRGIEKIEAPDGDGTEVPKPRIDTRSTNERQATRDRLSGL